MFARIVISLWAVTFLWDEIAQGQKWMILVGGRSSEPTCVDIPKNLTLCENIGYTKMRLPNLLDHDSLAEVSQQAASWVPLLNVRCDPDTQLFLCSLFSPVCLDRPIYPCRSLCQKVQASCQGRMLTYGFPWPEMVKCDKFPIDNDMCIASLARNGNATLDENCIACNQVDTYENILDNYCRADFALRTRIKKRKGSNLYCRKSRVYKQENVSRNAIKKPFMVLPGSVQDGCCRNVQADPKKGSKTKYLIMGSNREGELYPTFIMPWQRRSKVFRHAIRTFKRLNCSDPRLVTQTMIENAGARMVPPSAMSPRGSPVHLVPSPGMSMAQSPSRRNRSNIVGRGRRRRKGGRKGRRRNKGNRRDRRNRNRKGRRLGGGKGKRRDQNVFDTPDRSS